MIVEASIDDLYQAILNRESLFVLAYTSMCGTCESANRMLEVVSYTIPDIKYLKINITINKKVIDDYNISSIPCFLLFKNGKLKETFYAFYSVIYLLEKAKSLIS